MDEILLELIKNNNKVIIPEFGAFIVKHRNPLQVVFNEFLTFNDGVLIDAYSKKFNISKEEAKEKINAWIEISRSNIEKNKEFEIKGLGILKKLETGKIQLEIKNTTSKEKNSVEKEEGKSIESLDLISPEENKKNLSEIKDENRIQNEDKNIRNVSLSQEKDTKVKSEKEKDISKIIPPIEKTVKFREPDLANVYPKTTHVKGNLQDIEKQNSNMYYKKKTNKTGKVIKWLFFIIILNLLLVLIFIYSENIINLYNKNYPIVKQKIISLFKEKNQSKEPIGKISDSKTLDNTKNEIIENTKDNVSTTTMENVTGEVSTNKDESSVVSQSTQSNNIKSKYYIVAGCFREESNADSYVIMLRNKGYPAEKFGKIGDLTAVCYASFNSKEEALEMLKKVRESESKEAWIFHY